MKAGVLDQYLVKVRFFGEERDIREFIQPWSAPVVRIAEELPAGKSEAIFATWQYINQHVKYPPRQPYDYRYQEAFTRTPGGVKVFEKQVALLSESRLDFWQMPAETLASGNGWGDCEDSSFVGVSILRNRMSEKEIFATLGIWEGYGHAWVTVIRNGQAYVVETTSAAQRVLRPEGGTYVPYLRFNDIAFQEVRPGLMSGVRPRRRVDVEKLKKH